MHGWNDVAGLFEAVRDLQQASGIARDDEVGMGLEHVSDLAIAERSRRVRLHEVIDTRRAAADFGLRDLAQLHLRDGLQDAPRWLSDALDRKSVV